MGRGRCQRRRERLKAAHTYYPRQSDYPLFRTSGVSGIGRAAVYAGSDLEGGIRCQRRRQTRDIDGGGFDRRL